MKKLMLLLLALMLALPSALGEGTGALTLDQLKSRIDTNPYVNLIDVRDAAAYDAAHLPNAMNMPLDELQAEMQAILDGGFSYMDAEIIVYGQEEPDSRKAADIVSALGFTNVSFAWDIAAWSHKLIDTQTEAAQAMRILGGMDAMDIHGNPVTEELIFSQKLTMVNVWATYCNPCLQEMPDLGRIAQEMKDQGVQIVGVVSDTLDYYGNRDEKNIALAQEIAQSTQADYVHIVPDLTIMQKLLPQISSVPTTFFLDQAGNLVGGVYLGSRNYEQWMAIINETLPLVNGAEVAQ
ncbi:MAG: redoxin domain-containing protein [Clostridiales bacterium]|nr:redoxin domain-containing protein [Clostridiales bacterium]